VREALRVGILADTIDLPGGIGRYVREVLAECATRDDVRLTVLAPAAGTARVRELCEPVLDGLVVPPRSDQLSLAVWERARAGAAFEHAGVDVIVGTKHLVPRTRRPTVLVVHDVLTVTRAHENALPKRLLLPRAFRSSLTAADRLVAVSHATRSRLTELDPTLAAKCTVIPNGMSRRLLEAPPRRPVGVPDAFALVVGDLSPRKNLSLLTTIWSEPSPPAVPLVLVGPDPGGPNPVREALLTRERAGRLVWIRGADDAELRWCYEHARVVLFPTFEEGFGLPVLEAMSFGAPVVASTDPALREVAAGHAGVTHLDPTDAGAWRRVVDGMVGTTRAPAEPAIPDRAITWAEHTERLLAVARRLVPDRR
jgi:glycosyltransferase involved in cell wall biosynthesis